MRIGVDEVAFPIDVFSVATEIAEHPCAGEGFEKLLALVEDPENYFTRWAAVRAIGLMGLDYVHRAAGTLERQGEIEDYELASDEIRGLLARIAESE